MYKPDDGQMCIFDYTLKDTFELDSNNRWVKCAKCVPWEKAEQKYAHMFQKNGRPAKQIRMALGALLIKEYLKCSDEETVQSITEQPYLQYSIGLKKFTNEPPFDPSLMLWFRKRLTLKFMAEIDEEMCAGEAAPQEETPPKDDDDEPHGGSMIVDATCAPADIKYPTDTSLMAEAIEKTVRNDRRASQAVYREAAASEDILRQIKEAVFRIHKATQAKRQNNTQG